MVVKLECFYCGRLLQKYTPPKRGWVTVPENLRTRDHVFPKHIRATMMSGPVDRFKTVDCCPECNRHKGELSLDEFRLVMAFRIGRVLKTDYSFPGERA